MSHLKSFSSHCYCLLINWSFFATNHQFIKKEESKRHCRRRHLPLRYTHILWSFDVQLASRSHRFVKAKDERKKKTLFQRKIFSFFFFFFFIWQALSDMFIDLRTNCRGVHLFSFIKCLLNRQSSRKKINAFSWIWRKGSLVFWIDLNDHFHTFERKKKNKK